MKTRLTAATLAALAAALLACAAASAEMVGIYRNGLDSTAQRSQLIKLSGRSCGRGGEGKAMRITVGKRTDACAYRTPVLGRDLEIAATERLLSGTPTALQRKAYLSVELRAGGGGGYALLVYPLQRKVQLVRTTAEEGTEYLAIEKDVAGIKGLDQANTLRLRATNAEKGTAKLLGFLGSTVVIEATDEEAGELEGSASAVAIGAAKNAVGLLGSVDDVVIRVPSPF